MTARKEKAIAPQVEVRDPMGAIGEHVQQTSQSSTCPLQFDPFGPVPEEAYECLPKVHGPKAGFVKYWEQSRLQQAQINRLKKEGKHFDGHLGELATTHSIEKVPMPNSFGLVGALTKEELGSLIAQYRAMAAAGNRNPLFERAALDLELELETLLHKEQEAAMRFFAQNMERIATAIAQETSEGEMAFKAICALLDTRLHEIGRRALIAIRDGTTSFASRAKAVLERMSQP